MVTLGLLAAARDLGVEVPGDLAVVGYDDTAGAGFFSPPLTTLSQPFDELGRLCLEVLLEGVSGEAGRSHSISPTLDRDDRHDEQRAVPGGEGDDLSGGDRGEHLADVGGDVGHAQVAAGGLLVLRDAVDEAIAVHIREVVNFEGLSWSAAAAALAPSPTALRCRYRRANSE